MLEKATDGVDERFDVRDRAAAEACQKRGRFQLVDHLQGVAPRNRSKPQRRVVVQLGSDTAHAQQNNGSELNVVMKAEDQFDAAGDELLHQKAFRLVLCRRQEAFGYLRANACSVFRRDVDCDAAGFGLVQHIARQSLDDDIASKCLWRRLQLPPVF